MRAAIRPNFPAQTSVKVDTLQSHAHSAYTSLTVQMRSRGGPFGAIVLLTLFSSVRALAQAEDAALPAPPPPPPSPASAPSPQAQRPPPVAAPVAPLDESPSASPPRADAALPTATPTRSAWDDPERNWYGWQLLINDFVALGSIAGAAAADLKENAALAVIVPAAVVYDLGSPTIHWLHGRKGIAAASFGFTGSRGGH
jgi:hypothetical protein